MIASETSEFSNEINRDNKKISSPPRSRPNEERLHFLPSWHHKDERRKFDGSGKLNLLFHQRMRIMKMGKLSTFFLHCCHLNNLEWDGIICNAFKLS